MFIFLITTFLFSDASFLKPDAFLQDNKKVKVLVFLSESCPCSRSHVEHIGELQKKYSQASFYGVMTDRIGGAQDRLRLEKYYLSDKFKIPIIEDNQMKLVKLYGALKTPHVTVFALSENGVYEKVYEGGVSNDREFKASSTKYLQENLNSLFKEKKITYKVGHSLGCYIRRI